MEGAQRPFWPTPRSSQSLGDLADGEGGSFDAFAAVDAGEQLGAFGFRVGFGGALGGLPDLAAGGVAVGELELVRDGLAGLAVDALVDALGDAHPPWVWSPPMPGAGRSWENEPCIGANPSDAGPGASQAPPGHFSCRAAS